MLLAVCSGVFATNASAASFIYVATQNVTTNVSSVTGYSLTSGGSALSTPVSFAPSGGFADAFAIAVDSTGNVFVGDAGANKIYEFTSSGGAPIATFTLPTDGSTGPLSPQEIALDTNGNLYAAEYGPNNTGKVVKFATNGGGSGTVIQNFAAPVRGILVDTASGNTYVTTGTNGTTTSNVVRFATGTTGAQTNIYQNQAYPAGQLRGLALDATGKLYVADSGNPDAGTFAVTSGYITDTSTPTGASQSWGVVGGLSGLTTGPNDIAIGCDSVSEFGGHLTCGTNELYVANYFGQSITVYQLAGAGSPGSLVRTFSFAGSHVTGFAFDPGFIPAGTFSVGTEPGFFADLQTDTVNPTPEPGTWIMMLGALSLIGAGSYSRRKRVA